METIQYTKIRKIRVPHDCFACGRRFTSPAQMYHQINKFDGGISSVYWCETCDCLMREFSGWFYDDIEGFYPGGCVFEVVNDFKDVYTPEELLTTLRNKKKPHWNK